MRTPTRLAAAASAALVLAALLAAPSLAAPASPFEGSGLIPPRPHPVVLVVGTYHMDDAGLDLVKTKVPSSLSEKRQREIEDLVTKLAAFRPTRIAVEAPVGSTVIQQRYERYLNGEYTLGAGEIDQVALRLARRLGLRTLEPVDVKRDLDFDAVVADMQAAGQGDLLARFGRLQGFIAQYMDSLQRTHTVTGILRALNDPVFERDGHRAYLMMAQAGSDSSEAGVRLVSDWYERNLRIARAIVRAAGAGEERVLVLYGSGHAPLLRHFLAATPGIEVADPMTYLR
jgi:hypothetical protein